MSLHNPRSETITPGITASQGSLVASLDQIARLIEATGIGHSDAGERRRAQQLALTLDEGGPHRSAPQMLFAAALLGDLAVDLVADTAAAGRLIDDLEQVVGLSRAGLGREVLRGSHLSQLPVDVALHVQLSLLLLFTEAATISVWVHSEGGEARLLAQIGDPGSESVQLGAAQLLAGDHRTAAGESWSGHLVERGQLAPAAVIASGGGGGHARSDLALDAAAPQIAAILDRTELVVAGEDDSSEVIASLERRLARLRYDLHDGPQQDVHLLALDLRLFRDQLGSVVEGQPNADRLMGRLDDLEAQLVALDSELRQISTSMQSPFLPAGTLAEALEEITSAFASRTSIHPEVDLSGNFGQLSDSQQITLLALIREALNNVQKHSQATRVTITIAAHSRGVDAQVVDDGQGFDPEQTLVKAAREGHLGVVGIHERVRMLGGHARIESRPGGPTVISVTIPSWTPAQPGRDLVDRR